MKDWLDLNNRVYIVTGGSSGIGAAIVKELINHKAKVVIAARHCQEERSNKALFLKTDITNKTNIDQTVAKTIAKFGHIDGLVNNAGICKPGLLIDPKGNQEISEQDYEQMFSVNVKGLLFMTQAVGHQLVKQKKGVIVNISSTSGFDGSRGASVYAATKGAVNNFTRSWAEELGNLNVRVVGVAPGIMEKTNLRSPAYEKALAYTRNLTVSQLRANYKKTSTIPMNRSGHLSEVADLTAYLLSDRASYITGITINVAGGKSVSRG